MAFKRSLAIDILAVQGVKVGQGTAFVDDDTFCEVLWPFFKKAPAPGTTIEVEYVNGKPQAVLYR